MNKRSGIESRKRIIAAAMDVFSRKGYARANIREIAKTAGLSVGGVYLYFRNKEDLYLSLLKNEMQDLVSQTKKIVEQIESPGKALSEYLKMHFEYALKHKELILLHIREHGFAFGIEVKRRFFKNQQNLIAQIIARGIRSGEFRRCNPQEMAKTIMGALRGVVLSMALDKEVHISSKVLNEVIFRGISNSAQRGRV